MYWVDTYCYHHIFVTSYNNNGLYIDWRYNMTMFRSDVFRREERFRLQLSYLYLYLVNHIYIFSWIFFGGEGLGCWTWKIIVIYKYTYICFNKVLIIIIISGFIDVNGFAPLLKKKCNPWSPLYGAVLSILLDEKQAHLYNEWCRFKPQKFYNTRSDNNYDRHRQSNMQFFFSCTTKTTLIVL